MKKILLVLLALFFNMQIVNANSINEDNIFLANSDNTILPYSTIHKTDNKKLNIKKTCNNTKCTINVTLEWLNMPKIRSYDILGARFEETSLLNEPTTMLFLDGVKKNITMYTVKKSNGFGVSFKLPSGGSSLKVTQIFEVSIGGTIYASYHDGTVHDLSVNLQKSDGSETGYKNIGTNDTYVFSNSTFKKTGSYRVKLRNSATSIYKYWTSGIWYYSV